MSVSLRFAALYIPQFRLQAVQAQHPSLAPSLAPSTVRRTGYTPRRPVALVDAQSSRSLLLEVNAPAQRAGITPGMTGSQAMAREPSLELLHACPLAETRLCKGLLEFCQTLSPRVEKRAPSLWMLDLRGVSIPGWEAWARRALEALRGRENVQGRMGVAPRPALAWCAAHRANPVRLVEEPEAFVEDLSFEELGVSETLRQKLHDWGVRALGDLLRLPRQAALERLGPEAAGLWKIARDTRESVLHVECFAEALEQALDFDQPLETVAPLLFSLNRMVEQFCARLRLLHRVAAGMRMELQLENGTAYTHAFTIPAPCREEEVLLRVLQTHLETLQFDAAVTGVRLGIEASLPECRQLTLFESPLRDPNRFGETLARLRALAGEDAVGVPLPSPSHRAGAFHLEDPLAYFGAPPPAARILPAGASEMHGTAVGLPLRRFRPALPAQVRLQGHQPVQVRVPGMEAPVLESRGPYRLCGDWWDGQRWKQEEWDVQLGGRAAGLYRLGCDKLLESPAGCWWMEGCYDGAWWPAQEKA